MGGLNGGVVTFGVTVKIFFGGKQTANVVTLNVERQKGECPGNTAVAFDKRVDGDEDVLADGRADSRVDLPGSWRVDPINEIGDQIRNFNGGWRPMSYLTGAGVFENHLLVTVMAKFGVGNNFLSG